MLFQYYGVRLQFCVLEQLLSQATKPFGEKEFPLVCFEMIPPDIERLASELQEDSACGSNVLPGEGVQKKSSVSTTCPLRKCFHAYLDSILGTNCIENELKAPVCIRKDILSTLWVSIIKDCLGPTRSDKLEITRSTRGNDMIASPKKSATPRNTYLIR